MTTIARKPKDSRKELRYEWTFLHGDTTKFELKEALRKYWPDLYNTIDDLVNETAREESPGVF